MTIRKDGRPREPQIDARDDGPPEAGRRAGSTRAGSTIERWVDGPPAGASALEERAARLFRRALPPAGLSPQARVRVRARLADSSAEPAFVRQRQRSGRATGLRWGIAAGLLMGSGVVIAARGVDRWFTAAPAPAVGTPAPSPGANVAGEGPSRRRRAGGARPAELAAAEQSAQEPTEQPTEQSTEQSTIAAPVGPPPPAPTVASPPAATVVRAPIAGPPESRLAGETRLLNRALERLRQHRDAPGALEALDQYLRRFPDGTLAAEARTARIDALLMLSRKHEALLALDAMTFGEGQRQQELRTIRGELRAATDCAAAVADFDQLLSGAPPPELGQRALYGRAVCRSRQGQRDAARDDAERYAVAFPAGRFIGEMRRMLAAPGSSPAAARPAGPDGDNSR